MKKVFGGSAIVAIIAAVLLFLWFQTRDDGMQEDLANVLPSDSSSRGDTTISEEKEPADNSSAKSAQEESFQENNQKQDNQDNADEAPDEASESVSLGTPTFDVIRVTPQGEAIMAGKAYPHSQVTIKDQDGIIGHTLADSRGEWIFVPDTPLPPGERYLSLEMQVEGASSIMSDSQFILVVPDRQESPVALSGAEKDNEKKNGEEQGAVVLELGKFSQKGSRVLGEAKQDESEMENIPQVSIDSVDYQGDSVWIFGSALPDHLVRLYLDNKFIGEVLSSPDGKWRFSTAQDISAGEYMLRSDVIGDKGRVLARSEFPFLKSEYLVTEFPFPSKTKEKQSSVDENSSHRYIVQPGNSLWRIARSGYGAGIAYTIIYEANKNQIKDPDMIYPGQVFVLPPSEKFSR